MTQGSYQQFCPLAMASEILCTRWTMLVMRELCYGTTRFNDLRRGLSRMSPTLLSQRLKELEAAGIVQRKPAPKEPGVFEYHLTVAGRELESVVQAMGKWGHRWVETQPTLQHLDAQLLMWDMRRHLNPDPLPDKRVTVHVQYPEQTPSQRTWWMVIEPEAGVDLCGVDPGYEVDLYITSDLRTMTAVWMGYESMRTAISNKKILLTGDRKLASSIQQWFGFNPIGKEKKMVS